MVVKLSPVTLAYMSCVVTIFFINIYFIFQAGKKIIIAISCIFQDCIQHGEVFGCELPLWVQPDQGGEGHEGPWGDSYM